MTGPIEPGDDAVAPTANPAFSVCPRCRYSLRGLPANHACPECGLRYDEQSEIYRVMDPKKVLLVWLMIFGSGWVVLRHLPHIFNFAAASTWQKIGALAALLWIPFILTFVWYLVSRYRRGYAAAVTADGLILRLPGFTEDLIPWSDMDHARVKTDRPDKPQVVTVHLKGTKKALDIGGVANVFPTREHAERFVGQVNKRAQAGETESG